jgi:hypothetical protein
MKTIFLAVALVVTFAAAPVMAEQFSPFSQQR